jgi:hypothetical protein
MGALLYAAGTNTALVVHAIAAPVFFAALAWNYFRARGARDPLPTAFGWTALVILLDLVVVAAGIQRSLSMFTSFAGTWLPFTLIFLVTWGFGTMMSMMPSSTSTESGTDSHADVRAEAK